MAVPIRKLCETKFGLSRLQMWSRARRLLVCDARVRLVDEFEERLGGTVSVCLKKIVLKGGDGAEVRV